MIMGLEVRPVGYYLELRYKMKRIIILLAIILIGTLVPASASDDGLRLGIRVGPNMNMYFVEYSDKGYGFEAGLAAKYSTNRLSLNSEVNFCYRVLGNYRYNGAVYTSIEEEDNDRWSVKSLGPFVYYGDGELKSSFSEMAILAPIMIQLTSVKNVPFYMSSGVQLGFPFNSKFKNSAKITFEEEILEEYYKETNIDVYRFSIDFGVAFGVGCMAMSNLGVDFRYVMNLNKVYDGYGFWGGKLGYFTLGVSYFL
jgi:hypothetical protein